MEQRIKYITNFSKLRHIVLTFWIILWPLCCLPLLSFYFLNAFERYSVYTQLSGTSSQLQTEFSSVLQMLYPPFTTQMNAEFFRREDILHMLDVQFLFMIFWTVLFVCTAFIVIKLYLNSDYLNRSHFRKLRKEFLKFSRIIWVIIGLVLLFSLLSWNRLFELMHQILFFSNDYWILNPASSKLINFLPQGIFQELAALWLGTIVLQYFVIYLFCYLGRSKQT